MLYSDCTVFLFHFNVILSYLASTVNFTQLICSVAEHVGPLQPALIVSNPLTADLTIQVTDKNNTAIGEYMITLICIKDP